MTHFEVVITFMALGTLLLLALCEDKDAMMKCEKSGFSNEECFYLLNR